MDSSAYQKMKATGSLPSPKGVALEILRITDDNGSTVDEIARLVESDPATAARLLRYANSPLSGLCRNVTSIRQSIVLCGMQAVKYIALGFSLLETKKACAGFDYRRYWSDSLARAVTARHVAGRRRCCPPDEAFTCGLLSQIGALAFATVYPEAYAHLLKIADASQPEKILANEQEMFGLDRHQLSAEMLADWSLPAYFSRAVLSQRAPEPQRTCSDDRAGYLSELLRLGARAAPILIEAEASREALTGLVHAGQRIDILPDVLDEVWASVSQEWRDMGDVFSVPTRDVPPLAELYARAQQLSDRLTAPKRESA